MSAADVPLRVEFYKLRTLVWALAAQQNNLASFTALVGVYADVPALAAADASSRSIIFIQSNTFGEFGIYFPDAAAGTPNGQTVVQDVVGTKFLRYV